MPQPVVADHVFVAQPDHFSAPLVAGFRLVAFAAGLAALGALAS